MIGRVVTRLWAFAATAVISMAAMLAFPTSASAHYLTVSVAPVLPQVSISVPPRLSYASYEVTAVNNTNATISGMAFYGVTTVLPTNAAATYQESSITCISAYAPWAIQCNLPPIAKHQTFKFTITYVAPSSGDQLRLGWGVDNCPPTSEAGASLINLVDQSAADIAAGFETIVPKTGGTFYTGVAGGSATIPGSAPTKMDPFTTTVVVPSGFSTTATVAEAVVPSSCSANYSQCYESNLTIPGSFPSHLIIYLRIDVTRLTPSSNLANAVIYYQHTSADQLLPVEACGPGLPAPSRPCIESRQRYMTNAPTPAWKGDWEFKIQALDNGRYIN